LNYVRDVWIIARYELGEAIRSRRVLVLALLYVGGATIGSIFFVDMLAQFEETVSRTLLVPDPSKPGALTDAMLQSNEFRNVLARLLDDSALADRLIALPPLATFYGWLALTFAPVLVMLTSVDTIANDLQTGAARFALVRTDRLTWAVGKLLGQTLLMIGSLALGAFACLLVGSLRMAHFDFVQTLFWLLVNSWSAVVYAFAYIGLALGLSQLTRSAHTARALGLFCLALFGIARAVLASDLLNEKLPVIAQSLTLLFPRTYQLDLWSDALGKQAPAVIMLIALGISYFAAGYAYRRTKDA
jgi:ABC-type transport system involved in multi-copper enzyme maturation permease subunit